MLGSKTLSIAWILVGLLTSISRADDSISKIVADWCNPLETSDSLYIDFVRTVELDRNHHFQGSRVTIQYWKVGNYRRRDLVEIRPHDPKNAMNDRMAFDGERYIVARGKKNAFGKYVAGEDYYDRGEAPPLLRSLMIDYELLGLVPCRAGSIQNNSLSQLIAKRDFPETEVAFADNVITVRQENDTTTYHLDAEQGLRPTRISRRFSNARGVFRYEMITKWSTDEGDFYHPSHIVFSVFETESEIYREDIRVREFSLDHPIPASRFSWQGMGIDDGYVVVRFDSSLEEQMRVQWDEDRQQFVDWEFEPAFWQYPNFMKPKKMEITKEGLGNDQ